MSLVVIIVVFACWMESNPHPSVFLYRIVIQAAPPFLVVHANAAFTRLTGVDSHEVNGRSISNLFTIPPPNVNRQNNNEGAVRTHEAAAAAGRARAHDESVGMNVERLVVAHGFDGYHVISVAAKFSGVDAVQCRMCVSPVIAQTMPPRDSTGVVTDTNHESHHHKRRKHHHHEGQVVAVKHQKPAAMPKPNSYYRSEQQNIITHYVIQLEKITVDDAQRRGSDSKSDTALVEEVAQDETSQSTDPSEPVEAVG